MRFLTDDELPEPERERRKSARDLIALCQRHITEEWQRAEPYLTRLVQDGEYGKEQHYRGEVIRRTEHLRQEIQRLNEYLPPYLEMRKDELLERVARPLVSGQTVKDDR